MPLFSSHTVLAAVVLIMASMSYARAATYTLPEETPTLRPGPGVEAAQNCLTCHSIDYVSTQPPNRTKAFWEAEVSKMIKAYHAPINDEDAKTIVNYLAKIY
ncbi:cytochrome c [Methylocapsa sp. D3K7]|uniref:SorB family sulfite dehydrogenase c-type cytochrome subunit n=1 Tax=Methylocapsa sp. D3K7 TaxID=3041435 RepID=UPI00244E9EE9|nr:cytochrome c [Methylocapsa sp. D3K7]WGJ15528.1 cytochrome c [Methylocapsa sp. D3K7]